MSHSSIIAMTLIHTSGSVPCRQSSPDRLWLDCQSHVPLGPAVLRTVIDGTATDSPVKVIGIDGKIVQIRSGEIT